MSTPAGLQQTCALVKQVVAKLVVLYREELYTIHSSHPQLHEQCRASGFQLLTKIRRKQTAVPSTFTTCYVTALRSSELHQILLNCHCASRVVSDPSGSPSTISFDSFHWLHPIENHHCCPRLTNPSDPEATEE